MGNIYSYLNYREFLGELFSKKKSEEKFTYREFSKRVGVNSPSWLSQLITGKKNLTSASAVRVAAAFNLGKREAEYFGHLVVFTQAKSSDVKDKAYQKMLLLKKNLRLETLEQDQYQLYNKWYFPVIRSLVSKINFKDNYKLLADKVLPRITAGEAKKAVKLLEKAGLIKKNKKGRWTQTQSMLSTGDEVDSLNVVNYHKAMTKIALNVHDHFPKERRDISSLTLGVNERDVEKIKNEVKAFRKKILGMVKGSSNPNSVYQMNFQLFPLTQEMEN